MVSRTIRIEQEDRMGKKDEGTKLIDEQLESLSSYRQQLQAQLYGFGKELEVIVYEIDLLTRMKMTITTRIQEQEKEEKDRDKDKEK